MRRVKEVEGWVWALALTFSRRVLSIVNRRTLSSTVNWKSPLERTGRGESLEKCQVFSQVPGCSSHLAAVGPSQIWFQPQTVVCLI